MVTNLQQKKIQFGKIKNFQENSKNYYANDYELI